jgi:hypothetical protein
VIPSLWVPPLDQPLLIRLTQHPASKHAAPTPPATMHVPVPAQLSILVEVPPSIIEAVWGDGGAGASAHEW